MYLNICAKYPTRIFAHILKLTNKKGEKKRHLEKEIASVMCEREEWVLCVLNWRHREEWLAFVISGREGDTARVYPTGRDKPNIKLWTRTLAWGELIPGLKEKLRKTLSIWVITKNLQWSGEKETLYNTNVEESTRWKERLRRSFHRNPGCDCSLMISWKV